MLLFPSATIIEIESTIGDDYPYDTLVENVVMEEAGKIDVQYLRRIVLQPLSVPSNRTRLIICCGGQSGADQGAMAAAKEAGYNVCGFVPRGYQCENNADIEHMFPTLTETPLADHNQRTEWNCLVCDCYLTFSPKLADDSPGTAFGLDIIDEGNKPSIVLDDFENIYDTLPDVVKWLEDILRKNDKKIVLIGIGGHRESQAPGIYDVTYGYVLKLLNSLRPRWI